MACASKINQTLCIINDSPICQLVNIYWVAYALSLPTHASNRSEHQLSCQVYTWSTKPLGKNFAIFAIKWKSSSSQAKVFRKENYSVFLWFGYFPLAVNMKKVWKQAKSCKICCFKTLKLCTWINLMRMKTRKWNLPKDKINQKQPQILQ